MNINDDDFHDLNDAFDYLIGCYNILYGDKGYDKFMDQLRTWLRNQGYKLTSNIEMGGN